MKKKVLIVVLTALCILVYAIHGVSACTLYFSGSWPSANPLRVHVDPSASAYSQAVNPFGWNYITSKVHFSSVHVGGTSCSDCKVFIRYGVIQFENPVAITQNYLSNFTIDTWMTGSWVKSVITANSREVTLHDGTPFEFASATNYLRQYIIVHELGHTLGLKHQDKYCPESSIMWKNLWREATFNTPRPHDANTLIAKYGQ